MVNKTVSLLLAVTAFAAAGTVQAQARDGSRAFERMDGNGDGVVTQAEVTALREKAFERLDADGDGMISAQERDGAKPRAERFKERRSARGQERYSEADANGDGTLSREEFMNAPEPIMQKADADHNGELTRDEFNSFTARARAKAQAGTQ